MAGYARATAGAAAVVAALALTSCSDGAGAQPSPSSAGSSSTASSSSTSGSTSTTTSTPSGTATVDVPAAAREHSEDGAKAFAAVFVDALNESQVSADATKLRAISAQSCRGCNVYIESAEAMQAKGHHADNPSMRLDGVIVRPSNSTSVINLDLLIEESASATVDRNGKVIESFDGGKLTIRTELRATPNAWVVQQALLVS